jgi:hypothetical protein
VKKIEIQDLEYFSFRQVAKDLSEQVKNEGKPRTAAKGGVWVIRDGITPVELYCYLNARFGAANGFQMALRADDSDNLIHWHYTLKYKGETLEIMSLTFRLEIMHSMEFDDSESAKESFISDIKQDFKNHGKKISEFRKSIEEWDLFINPFFRIKKVIEHQLYKLEALEIEKIEPFSQPTSSDDLEGFSDRMNEISEAYTEATALGLNIRMLAPVYAESFINLLIFLLAEDDIKNDKRMYESVIRQQIDIRIKGLHRHCKGFYQPIDYNNIDACKEFHTLMNNRNDLLHGNIDPRKLVYEKVFFDGKVPLFNDYRNFSFFSWEASIKSVSPDLAIGDYQVVQDLIAYILVCLDDKVREQVKCFMETKDPGWNEKGKRAGVLFPGHLVDMIPPFGEKEFNKQQ